MERRHLDDQGCEIVIWGRAGLPAAKPSARNSVMFMVRVPKTEVERSSIETGDDGLPIIRTNNGVITSRLVKEIETQTV